MGAVYPGTYYKGYIVQRRKRERERGGRREREMSLSAFYKNF